MKLLCKLNKPLRQLALQRQVFSAIKSYENLFTYFLFLLAAGFKVASFIGGLELLEDRRKIQGCRAVIGTPGRILHLIKNSVLNMDEIRIFVMDEADKLMSPSFFSDVKQIWQRIDAAAGRQVLAASATFANGLDTKVTQFMRNPIGVSPKREVPILLGVRQFAYIMPTADDKPLSNMQEMFAKVKAVQRIFAMVAFKQCIIFSNSQQRAESYANYLSANGWTADVITGSQAQSVRLDIFKKFKTFKCRILVATDLMARGVDSENLNLVVNLDVPNDSVTYLHRIGRCGRFGTQGLAITLIASSREQCGFAKMLGCLGGSNVSVQKFPHERNDLVDIFTYENETERIFGTDVETKTVVKLKPEDMTTIEPRSISCSSESDEVTEERSSTSTPSPHIEGRSSTSQLSTPTPTDDSGPAKITTSQIVDQNLNLLQAAKWLIGDTEVNNESPLDDVFEHLGFKTEKVIEPPTVKESANVEQFDDYSMEANTSSVSNTLSAVVRKKNKKKFSYLDLDEPEGPPQYFVEHPQPRMRAYSLSNTVASILGSSLRFSISSSGSSTEDNLETAAADAVVAAATMTTTTINDDDQNKKPTLNGKDQSKTRNNYDLKSSGSYDHIESSSELESDDEADDEASIRGGAAYGATEKRVPLPGARPLLERRWKDMYQLQLHHIQSYVNYTQQFNVEGKKHI